MSEEISKTPDSPQNDATRDVTETKPIKSNEKITCSCGKVVMKKNMPVHELTNHHMNFIKETTKIAEPKETSKVPEKKTDVGIKIKSEFEALNTKLDELYDCVMDIYDFLMPEDIGEENIAPEK